MNTKSEQLDQESSKRLIEVLRNIMPEEHLRQERDNFSLCLGSIIKTIASFPSSDKDCDCELEAEMALHAAIFANYYFIYSEALKLMK